MGFVLAATGLFLHQRLNSDLTRAIDQGLDSRADDLASLVRAGSLGTGVAAVGFGHAGESVAQIIDPIGEQVVESTPELEDVPLLSTTELVRAQVEEVFADRASVRGLSGPWRLFSLPVMGANGQALIVVVGAPLDGRERALAVLRTQLFVAGPLLLLLAAVAGYVLATAALRPVERMRRRSSAISMTRPGERLPIPPAHDEIARLGKALNEMLARLEGAFQRERGFVSDASHELRTPLARLKAELELAKRPGRSRDELEASVRFAAEDTDLLVRLAEDLLLLARVQEGTLPLRLKPCVAEELLATVAGRFRRQAESAGRPIEVSGGRQEFVADSLRLEQALGNLVDNALRHGGGTVILSAARRDARVELHVTDQGPGFPQEFLGRAFERFTRADEARGPGGAGLGLAIVEAVARAHRGECQAENRPEGGADVWIAIPDPPASSSTTLRIEHPDHH